MRSYDSKGIFFSLPGQRHGFEVCVGGFRRSVVCHRRSELLSVQCSWEELKRVRLYRIALRRFRCWSCGLYSWMKMNHKVRRTRTSFAHQCHWDISVYNGLFLGASSQLLSCLNLEQLSTLNTDGSSNSTQHCGRSRAIASLSFCQTWNLNRSEPERNICSPNLCLKFLIFHVWKTILQCMWHLTSVSWFEIFMTHFCILNGIIIMWLEMR